MTTSSSVLALALGSVIACPTARAQEGTRDIVIHDFTKALAGVHARNPDVKLDVARDPSLGNEPVLRIEYPAATNDPAGRDVSLDAENRSWTGGGAITFRVKPAHAMRMSVSFIDRNHVVYTAWRDLPDTS